MTEHIKVKDERPYENISMLSGQTVVTIPFRFFSEDDIKVYSDGSLVDPGDYTVLGAGEEGDGVIRSVTFSTPALGGENVVIVRVTTVKRENDYTTSGSWTADNVNTDFDRIVMMLQENAESDKLSIRADRFDVEANLTLPTASTRAGKSIKFDSSGNVVVTTYDPDEAQAAAATASTSALTAVAAATAAQTAQGVSEDARDASQAYASQAAASAQAIGSREVVRITADYTATASDNGKQLLVLCSTADIAVTLPPGSATGEPWEIIGGKGDDTGYHADFVTSGGDTMTGGNVEGASTTYRLSSKGAGVMLRVDLDTDPDDWLATGLGAAVGDATPVGLIAPFAMGTVPSGWLECNGAAISRTTYADLFAAVGTLYGAGDGSTTFNLPELRGEFLRGWDHGRGVDTGRSLGGAQSDAFKSHIHTIDYGAGGGTLGSWTYYTTGGPGTSIDVNSVKPTGGSETRPRSIAVMFCIKAFNGVTNQAMIELGDLASDVAGLQAGGTQIGIGQTWQDMSGSRSIGTTYTNTTSKPIMVHVYGQPSTNPGTFQIVIGGTVTWYGTSAIADYKAEISAIIPPATTYQINVSGGLSTFQGWAELR